MTRAGFLRAFNPFAALLALAAGPIGLAASDGAGQSGERIGTVLRFMSGTYPELLDSSGVVQVQARLLAGMSTKLLGIQFGTGTELNANALDEATQCYGLFTFSDFGVLTYQAGGKCVNQAENSSFRRLLDNHPEWPDDRVIAELLRRGALYGPDAKQRLQDRIPPEHVVSALTGELVNLQEVEFITPQRENGKMLTPPIVGWRITYEVPGKPNVDVVAWLEPFQGRLRDLTRHPPEEGALELLSQLRQAVRR